MIPGNFARITVALIASLLAWPLTAHAQGNASGITVVSVLTQAKEEAEKADDDFTRIRLRAFVAHMIRVTGQKAAFADYVAQARAAYQALDSDVPRDEALKFNTELAATARRAFLAGDERQALELLNQCRPMLTGSPCGPSDTFVFSKETFVQNLFLNWEIYADKFEAALRRLKNVPWPPDFYQYVLIYVGPAMADGDSGKGVEIQRLIGQSGLSITACIVDDASIFRSERAPRVPTKPRPLSEIAMLRKLGCEGKAETALEMARSLKNAEQRVRAFGVIAEGLAGIPGFADEPFNF